jgi:hypothetical protein
MKTSNKIIAVVSAIATALLLVIWFYRGFNEVDNPLDVIVAIVAWAIVIIACVAIVKLEEKRKQQIRTVYVAQGKLFNSEAGLVAAEGATTAASIKDVLAKLKFGFEKQDMPGADQFDCAYVVKTDEFKDDENQPTWKGTVVKIDRVNGNKEMQFDGIEQLQAALA